MADEFADIASTEQLEIFLSWVDENLETHEDFICLSPPRSTNAEHLELRVSEGKGQSYDGAATMMGTKNGGAKRFRDLNPKMLVVHCFGHVLNYLYQISFITLSQ